MLRSWEARFAFPAPRRLDSGHRRYTQSDVGLVRTVVRLRESGLRLEAAIAEANAGDTAASGGSIYAAMRRSDPNSGAYRLRKATLLAFSWAIEDECSALAQQPNLFGAFQTEENYAGSAGRWKDLASCAKVAMVFADFSTAAGPDEPVRVPLLDPIPMRREWVVVCDAPTLSAALVAWELPGQAGVADHDRLFEAMWSFDPSVVRAVARTCAVVAQEHGVTEADDVLDELATLPATSVTAERVTSLLGRFVLYTDPKMAGSRT